jgi:hypothetical protein
MINLGYKAIISHKNFLLNKKNNKNIQKLYYVLKYPWTIGIMKTQNEQNKYRIQNHMFTGGNHYEFIWKARGPRG